MSIALRLLGGERLGRVPSTVRQGFVQTPRLSITHSGADEARRSAPVVHIAWPGPPTSSNRRMTGAKAIAPTARALVTSPVLSPSPNGAMAEICTDRP